ncbi:hypothetical protein BCR37DRAFT_399340 [Protomyces lactucae-debilis]|uniref:G-patch domain-containing protein n=1 Tax=Protomyces lactucae-debilis TaxID=2754530 RepID=A0A1Y2FAQ4_PROLT|nr:uncharacterized protein BCR37DRAFT_399340 [Protomyces lactucae-debilis]ORY80990.1 hypothetical protein BCR37DRAFT_399340 [Protomyces lactucae-debilis]
MSLYSSFHNPDSPAKGQPAPRKEKASLYHDTPVMAELPEHLARRSPSVEKPSSLHSYNAALQFYPPRRKTVDKQAKTSRPLHTTAAVLPFVAPTKAYEAYTNYDLEDVAEEYRQSKKQKIKKVAPAKTSLIDWRASYDPRRPIELSDWLLSDERLEELEEWKKVKQRRLAASIVNADDTEALPPPTPGIQQKRRSVSPQQRPPTQPSLAPGQKGFAARYMAAQGWRKGDGLGTAGQGRLAPLFVRPGKDGIGQVIDKDRQTPRERPSRSILLMGLVKAGQEVDEMLQQDIGDACTASYGAVERVQLDWRTGRVVITFVDMQNAAQCVSSIGSRRFWGETVHASFIT